MKFLLKIYNELLNFTFIKMHVTWETTTQTSINIPKGLVSKEQEQVDALSST